MSCTRVCVARSFVYCAHARVDHQLHQTSELLSDLQRKFFLAPHAPVSLFVQDKQVRSVTMHFATPVLYAGRTISSGCER
jgi:hypothetical protein